MGRRGAPYRRSPITSGDVESLEHHHGGGATRTGGSGRPDFCWSWRRTGPTVQTGRRTAFAWMGWVGLGRVGSSRPSPCIRMLGPRSFSGLAQREGRKKGFIRSCAYGWHPPGSGPGLAPPYPHPTLLPAPATHPHTRRRVQNSTRPATRRVCGTRRVPAKVHRRGESTAADLGAAARTRRPAGAARPPLRQRRQGRAAASPSPWLAGRRRGQGAPPPSSRRGQGAPPPSSPD